MLVFILLYTGVASAFRPIMDKSGKLQAIPGEVDSGIVSVVTSPGMPAVVLQRESGAMTAPLGVMDNGSTLVCQGASLGTVSASDEITSTCLSLCGAVSDCMVLEGITVGDVDGGILNSRHARTLAALFRVRLAFKDRRQTLILVLSNSDETAFSCDTERLDQDLEVLFRAASLEQNEKDAELAKYFDVRVVVKPSGAEVSQISAYTVFSYRTVHRYFLWPKKRPNLPQGRQIPNRWHKRSKRRCVKFAMPAWRRQLALTLLKQLRPLWQY